MTKILVITTTRADFGLLKNLIKSLKKNKFSVCFVMYTCNNQTYIKNQNSKTLHAYIKKTQTTHHNNYSHDPQTQKRRASPRNHRHSKPNTQNDKQKQNEKRKL